jgi:nitroreductase
METLYANIFRRKSTRAFNMDSLDEASLGRVQEILDGAPDLFEGLHVRYDIIKDGREFSEKATGIIGAYTKVKAPHFLVVTIKEQSGFRQATGYSLAHVVLAMNDLGIATCITYPGVDKSIITKYMELEEDHEPILFVAFGNPLDPLELYPKAEYYKRRNLTDIIIQGPVKRKYKFILEAARLAPSSFNTQPWRFSMDGNRIHVMRVKLGFVKSKFFTSLNKIDMGIALAYMIIAIKAKGMKFKLIKDSTPHKDMEYMITIEIKE